MREFDYKKTYKNLLVPETVSWLSLLHEYKGKQGIDLKDKADILEGLLKIARVQSTDASNRIEGIITTKERLELLANSKTLPKSRSEKEIAGYRDVLDTIHRNYEYIPLRPSFILQLHRDLYKYSPSSRAGSFKNSDNVIAEELGDGQKFIRFRPVSSWETPIAVENICAEYSRVVADDNCDGLVVLLTFVFDFLCIHPFNDGNGRISRLLTLLLLYQSGYYVGKYISIEMLIEKRKDEYYDALLKSSVGWHEGENDYAPFVNYMLSVFCTAYKDFWQRFEALDKRNKAAAVRDTICSHIGAITKSEILNLIPNISEVTVERALLELKNSGEILKIGGGRYTKYIWNHDKSK